MARNILTTPPPEKRKPRNILAPPAYSGAILPFSRSAEGEISFDSNAGLFGLGKEFLRSLRGASEAVGEVARGAPVTEQTVDDVMPLAAIGTPINPAVRAGDRLIPGVARNLQKLEPEVPTAGTLRAAGGEGLDRARDMGVDYTSESVAGMAGALRTALEADGILGEIAPKTFSVIEKLASPPEGSFGSLTGLHAARRAFQNAAKDFSNPTEQLAAKRAMAAIDGFIQEPPAGSVMAGPATTAGNTFAEAIENYAAAKRSDRLHGVEEAAEFRAASANSGRNLDNTIRQRIASLLLSPKAKAGYSSEEVEALGNVSTGSFLRNRIRDAGNYMGGGGGLGGVVTGGITGLAAGSAGGSPTLGTIVGLGIPALGVGAKSVANALTRRALDKADTLVRKRSPYYRKLEEEAPMVAGPTMARAMLLRALLAAPGGQGGGGY